MRASRDRWPAILSREQEEILINAGFRYDGESGVLVHAKHRKVLSVEAAAERGAEELRDFVRKRNHPGQVADRLRRHTRSEAARVAAQALWLVAD